LKPPATTNPPMNATMAEAPPTASRVENRDAIANPDRVESCRYYTSCRRQVSLPAAQVLNRDYFFSSSTIS
jgi:hypothetical protein